MINAVALMAIAGGLAAYFRAYPTAVRYVNKTVTTTIAVVPPETNPAPGTSHFFLLFSFGLCFSFFRF